MSKPAPSLKAAAESKDDDSVRKSLPSFMVDPRIVVVEEGFNARPIDPEHVAYLKGLKRAGIDTGFLTLEMVDGKPTLRDGHHRHAADLELIAEGVEIKMVKALEFKGDEKARILFMLATGSNKPYTAMQVGEQYGKLINLYGMSYSEVAAMRGMSVQHVKDCIRLTEQPTELKAMIAAGEVAPATALKLVKRDGTTEAIKTLKQAASAPGVKVGKPISQKALDALGKGVIIAAAKNAEACITHLSAMLESPGFDAPTKAAIRDVMGLVQEKKERIAPKPAAETVRLWLESHAITHSHPLVVEAASLLRDVLDKKKLPTDTSGGAQYYGHMVWLQKLGETSKRETVRAAAHWFHAVLEAQNSPGRELAPAPSVLCLEDALLAEKDSDGHVRAETLCPEQAALIAWARGR